MNQHSHSRAGWRNPLSPQQRSGKFVRATKTDPCLICQRPDGKCGRAGDSHHCWNGSTYSPPQTDSKGLVRVNGTLFKKVAEGVGLGNNCTVFKPARYSRSASKPTAGRFKKAQPHEVVQIVLAFLELADQALATELFTEAALTREERDAAFNLVQRADERGQELLPKIRRFYREKPEALHSYDTFEKAVTACHHRQEDALSFRREYINDPLIFNPLADRTNDDQN